MDLIGGSLWVVDVEGSGGKPPEIVEIAITQLIDLKLSERRWEWLVRPNGPISPSATRIHGISDDDVANSPTIDDIAEDLMTWIDNSVIVGHNVRVEVEIIRRSVPYWTPLAAIDTIRVAKAVLPGLESYSLENLGAVLGHSIEANHISGRRHHSAMYDAVLASLVFVDLVSRVSVGKRNDLLIDANILDRSQRSLF